MRDAVRGWLNPPRQAVRGASHSRRDCHSRVVRFASRMKGVVAGGRGNGRTGMPAGRQRARLRAALLGLEL